MKQIQVAAGIIEENNKVLICQRHQAGEMPLKWEFPGGKIEPKETGPECLQRELWEELSIQASVGRLVSHTRHVYERHGSVAIEVHLFFYQIENYIGEMENNVFEQIRWVSRRELIRYDFLEADLDVVGMLFNGHI
ncbi:MAG: hypothetical protein B6244_08980 [Candidatus Cloacimonetes bacterium 4572_55]|nr:MAG: hypothetical protein B6244_08980 [Candidatus Cloacimonetes bacterium 4572_55]